MVLGVSAGEFDEGWHLFDRDTVLSVQSGTVRKHDWLPRRRPFDDEEKPVPSGQRKAPGKPKKVPHTSDRLPIVDLTRPVLSEKGERGIIDAVSLHASYGPKKHHREFSQMSEDEIMGVGQEELQNCRQLFAQSASELARLNSREYKRVRGEYEILDEHVEQLQGKPFISAQTVIELGAIEHQVTQLKESLILRLGSTLFKTFILDPLDHALKKLSHLRLLCSYAIVSQTNQMLKKRTARNHLKVGKKIRDERIEEARYVDF